MKTFVKQVALAALLVLLALPLVTCDDFLGLNPKPGEDVTEYVDWEYVDLPDGKSELTLYLDGTLVPVTEKTASPKQSRALNLQLAKMSHDYFEVIFWKDTDGTLPTNIARASWELGQASGISGVYRSAPGVNYTPAEPPTGGAAASVIFVGRKQTMTLLGVGVMTHINKREIGSGAPPGVSAVLTSSDRSVTFTVSPLLSKIGIDPQTNEAILGPPPSSFITAGKTPYAAVAAGNTVGRNTPLGGTEYPLFILPDFTTHSTGTGSDTGPLTLADGTASTIIDKATVYYKTVPAQYTIGGLTTATGLPAIPGSSVVDLTKAIILYARPEVIKREPRYVSGGQTWYAIAQIDFGGTEVEIPVAYTFTDGKALDPVLPINFYLTDKSNGIFSIVFSIPVYALTLGPFETGTVPKATSDNGGPPAEIWHITPGYGQNLYNLDNGTDAGGCVLLGVNVSSLDWLEIFTTGLGFKN